MVNNKILKAQSLIEIVIAIGLASLVLTALVVLGSASIKTSTSSIRRAEASKLASSGIEAIRYVRDNRGFSNFTDSSGNVETKCWEINDTQVDELANCTADDAPNNISAGWDVIQAGNISYERNIKTEKYAGSDDMVKATSVVRWEESIGAVPDRDNPGDPKYREVVVSTVFTRWKNKN